MGSLTILVVVITLVFSSFSLQPTESAAIASSAISYQSCNSDNILKIKGLMVNPDPPQVGKPVTITLAFESSEEINGGKVDLQIGGTGSLSFIKQSKSYDLCTVLPDGCPINKGLNSMTVTNDIPSFVPAGTYVVEVKASDSIGRSLFCADVTIQLSSGRRMLLF